MVKDILRESFIAALSFSCVRELPPEDDGQSVWIRAIGLAKKRDGSKGYVAIVKDKNGENKILKDFGSISQIVEIEKVYPTLYLDSSYLPTFETKKREEKIKWLSMQRPEEKFEELTGKELNRAILHVAMQNQLNDIYK